MFRTLSKWRRSAESFFRTAIFTAFFFGSRRESLIAFGGTIGLTLITIINPIVCLWFVQLGRTYNDMVQQHATLSNALPLLLLFCVYQTAFYAFDFGEIGRRYLAAIWMFAITWWFTAKWLWAGGQVDELKQPPSVPQRIVDRTESFVNAVAGLYLSLCRAFVSFFTFIFVLYPIGWDILVVFHVQLPYLWLMYIAASWAIVLAVVTSIGETWISTFIVKKTSLVKLTERRNELRGDYRDAIDEINKRGVGRAHMTEAERTDAELVLKWHFDKWMGFFFRVLYGDTVLYAWQRFCAQLWQLLLNPVIVLLAITSFIPFGEAIAFAAGFGETRSSLLSVSNSLETIVNSKADYIGMRRVEEAIVNPKERVSKQDPDDQ